MTRMRYIVCFFMLAWMAATVPALAQGITLSLNISAHPNPYLYEWEARRETAILTITNLSGGTTEGKLHVRVLVDGRLKAETNLDKMPIVSITPGVHIYMADELVPDYAVKFYDDVDVTVRKTGQLPAGTYEFCVELVNQKGERISGPECRTFMITSYQLPVLQQPEDKAIVRLPKRPIFRWSPVVPTPPGGVIYRVMLFEVLQGQYPMQAFRANQPIMDLETRMTQLIWPVEIPMPDGPMQYIWSVQALDQDRNPIGDRDGFAEPFVLSFEGAERSAGGK